jgi:hypothetical protein
VFTLVRCCCCCCLIRTVGFANSNYNSTPGTGTGALWGMLCARATICHSSGLQAVITCRQFPM